MAPSIRPALSTVFLVTCLALLAVANALMLYGYTNYPTDQEGFINYVMGGGFPGVSGGSDEGFANYALGGAGAGNAYTPIGVYDNVRKTPANGVSAWRDTKPNEPMAPITCSFSRTTSASLSAVAHLSVAAAAAFARPLSNAR